MSPLLATPSSRSVTLLSGEAMYKNSEGGGDGSASEGAQSAEYEDVKDKDKKADDKKD